MASTSSGRRSICWRRPRWRPVWSWPPSWSWTSRSTGTIASSRPAPKCSRPLAAATAEGGPTDVAYFWLGGALSAFLDNAPPYLVFFELAGGNPTALMGPLGSTLAARSMGAAYMGALTYIGNAPNLRIYAIAA